MAIKLRVISEQYRELGERRSRVFGVNGGSVGRAVDNDWVLPDPRRVVSGHHCDIEYRNGRFMLRDTSTNGVFVNDADAPVSESGPCELTDGDRLRIGDYEILVSVDERIDFLPNTQDRATAEKHLGRDLGARIDLDALLTSPRSTPGDSGSISVRNAFGLKVASVARGGGVMVDVPDEPPPPPPSLAPADWALKTRPITREELNDAIARRTRRDEVHEPGASAVAEGGSDSRNAVQAFCRGAGIDPAALSPQAQSLLPLVAGQLLRETVLGLSDLVTSRSAGADTPRTGGTASSNPIRSASSVESALQRLFESHGKRIGGPVDSLRDVLLEMKDHDEAAQAAMQAGVEAVLDSLSPANVADQLEASRASRTQPPATDPRPRYWEHYSEFHRLLTQTRGEALPPVFGEAYARVYAARRTELAARRRRG